MTEVVVKEIDNEEHKEEPIQEEAPKEEEKPEEIIEPSVEEKPQPAPKPKRVRPSRAKPPFDPEAFKSDLVKQIKEELQSAMTARDTYNKAKEEKNKATREKLKSLASKKIIIIYKNEHQGTENRTQQNRHLRKRPQGHQQKTNRPFKQKCQLQERNARNARQKKKSV